MVRGDDEVGESALDLGVSARARARGDGGDVGGWSRGDGGDVGGWSRGVAPRRERSVRSRGRSGVAARGRRGARRGRGRRRGRAGIRARRAWIFRARLRPSLRLRVPQQQARPVQEVLEPDDAARAKPVQAHRVGVTSLYPPQDTPHHLEAFRLGRIVHAAARGAFERAPRLFPVAPTRGPSAEGIVEATAVLTMHACLRMSCSDVRRKPRGRPRVVLRGVHAAVVVLGGAHEIIQPSPTKNTEVATPSRLRRPRSRARRAWITNRR